MTNILDVFRRRSAHHNSRSKCKPLWALPNYSIQYMRQTVHGITVTNEWTYVYEGYIIAIWPFAVLKLYYWNSRGGKLTIDFEQTVFHVVFGWKLKLNRASPLTVS